MRAWILGIAVLSGGLALSGCRAIQGLDDLSFDLPDSGGGASGVEDCTNGADDDGDGRSDCADPDCGAADFACVAGPPTGWSGPVALYEGAFDEAAPACPELYPDLAYQGDTGPEAMPASCSACACGAAPVTCSVGLELFSNATCSGNGVASTAIAPGTCFKLDASASSLELTAPVVTVKACTPSGGVATLPAAPRLTKGVACTAPSRSGGCSDEEICTPRPAAPFREARCIWRQGDQSCPASYPEHHRLETVMDDRGCTPCACGAPAPPSCAAMTKLFSDTTCGTKIANLPNDNSCVTSMPAAALVTLTDSGSAKCLPMGGAPTGAVAPTTQATICCSD
ncbi:MAG: hypothetical protein ABI134_17630 [Byssovorax sp.]